MQKEMKYFLILAGFLLLLASIDQGRAGQVTLTADALQDQYASQGARIGYDDYFYEPGTLEFLLCPQGPIIPRTRTPGN